MAIASCGSSRLLSTVTAKAERQAMEFPRKQLILVGDRVLITPEEGEDRTRVGLYLPPTAIESQQVQSGLVIAVGPGDPVPEVGDSDEPWRASERPVRWRPMQARVGDHAIFFRKAAVEITFEEKKYLVVPQGAILALVREDLPI
jgi:chaperonin GroES